MLEPAHQSVSGHAKAGIALLHRRQWERERQQIKDHIAELQLRGDAIVIVAWCVYKTAGFYQAMTFLDEVSADQWERKREWET